MLPGLLARLSLRAKLYLNLGFICLALGAVSVFANWSISIAASKSRALLDTSVRQADIAAEVAEATLQCRRFEKDVFLNMGNAEEYKTYRGRWQKAFNELTGHIKDFGDAVTREDDHKAAQSWDEAAKEYKKAMEGVFEGIDNKSIQRPEEANKRITPFKEHIRTLTDLATETSRRKMKEANEAGTELSDTTAFLKTLILIVTLAAVVVVLIWCYLLAADLMRAVTALSDAARRVGGGDWYTRVELNREDELGKLADCFNQMMTNIRERVGEKKE